MRRYLGSMRRVPPAPFGHRVIAVNAAWGEQHHCDTHGGRESTYLASWREERGRRRSAIHITELWLCSECARAWAEKHRVEMPEASP